MHVEASFRYAGDWFPFDPDLIRQRRYLIMDLVTGARRVIVASSLRTVSA